jgi:hypothetical protein
MDGKGKEVAEADRLPAGRWGPLSGLERNLVSILPLISSIDMCDFISMWGGMGGDTGDRNPSRL